MPAFEEGKEAFKRGERKGDGRDGYRRRCKTFNDRAQADFEAGYDAARAAERSAREAEERAQERIREEQENALATLSSTPLTDELAMSLFSEGQYAFRRFGYNIPMTPTATVQDNDSDNPAERWLHIMALGFLPDNLPASWLDIIALGCAAELEAITEHPHRHEAQSQNAGKRYWAAVGSWFPITPEHQAYMDRSDAKALRDIEDAFRNIKENPLEARQEEYAAASKDLKQRIRDGYWTAKGPDDRCAIFALKLERLRIRALREIAWRYQEQQAISRAAERENAMRLANEARVQQQKEANRVAAEHAAQQEIADLTFSMTFGFMMRNMASNSRSDRVRAVTQDLGRHNVQESGTLWSSSLQMLPNDNPAFRAIGQEGRSGNEMYQDSTARKQQREALVGANSQVSEHLRDLQDSVNRTNDFLNSGKIQ